MILAEAQQHVQHAWFWAFAYAIAQYLIVAAISYFAYKALAKDQAGRKPAGVQEFELPTAEDGRPLQHVRGKRMLTGFNCLTPIHRYTYDRKKRDGQVVGYYYYWNMWVGLCIVADGVKQIWAGGYCLAPTLNDDTQEEADGASFISVNAVSVFGGWEGEGGQFGHVFIYYGDSSQLPPDDVVNTFGDVPAARNIVTAYFAGVSGYTYSYIWGTTHYPKWPEFMIKSTDKASDLTTIWQSTYSNIGSEDDFNPVHALYELITDSIVGRGLSTSLIGTSFATAAATLYGEGYGVSYVLDSNKDEIQDHIDTLCAIIDGFLYFDQDSGKFELALARDDYDPDNLEEFDESDFWMSQFNRPSAGKTPSNVVVHYTDRLTNDADSVAEDDIALLELQGGRPITQEYDYKAWICSRTTAQLIASREQQQFSALQANMTLHCKRTMSHLNQGDVVKIAYGPLQITTMIVRVLKVDRGDRTNEEVILEVVEDAYGTIYSSFGIPAEPASSPSAPYVDTPNNFIMTSVATSETGPY